MRAERDKARLRMLHEATEAVEAQGLHINWTVKRKSISIPFLGLEDGIERGRGLGTRLLTQFFEACDRIGLTVYVTPAERTLGYYERFGFKWPKRQVICESNDLCQMIRKPRKWRPSR